DADPSAGASGPDWDLPTNVLSDTLMEVTLPAAKLRAGAEHQISVRTTSNFGDGGVTAALPFTVRNPAPRIAQLSQSYARTHDVSRFDPQHSSLFLTITGDGFVSDANGQDPLSVVTVNGVVHPASFLSSTQLEIGLGWFQGTGDGKPNEFATPGVLNILVSN